MIDSESASPWGRENRAGRGRRAKPMLVAWASPRTTIQRRFAASSRGAGSLGSVISARLLLGDGDREAEPASPALVLLDPDPAVVALDDPLADREADPAAGIRLAAVQPLEHGEDPFRVARIDPDPVV